jgi:hypothetical protein
MNYESLVSEFLQLRDSTFWKFYSDKIDSMLSNRMDKMKTCSIDSVLSTQGEIRALEIVKSLPDNLIKELSENSKQGA